MKKIFILIIGVIMFNSCQNELYQDATEDFQVEQGAYIENSGIMQLFVEEGKTIEVKGVKVSLTKKEQTEISNPITFGDNTQIEKYNKTNGTNYILLPKEMYEASENVQFLPNYTTAEVNVKLKDVKFSTKGTYAIPIKLKNGGASAIEGQDETIIVLEQKIVTKSLRVSGYGAEDPNMFANDFKVAQWTMEVMVNRSSYRSNNKAICGTKVVQGSSALDEIYTRFGDVTIKPNQLQIKTGASQIDIPSEKLSAQPNTWYMLSFVYDGKNTMVYVNGELAAEREIREGAYGLTGFWFSGANELIREVRFWSVARTKTQIKDGVWKMANPNAEGLLLYYPMNGKKFDHETGEIVDDETMIWDWSKNMKHMNMPQHAIFDNNGGDNFIFPPEIK